MIKIFCLAFVARIGLMLYGAWQDANMDVKYTDVDYYVFADAAKFVSQGKSPYQRATYRYTPLLAWALTPNFWLSPYFGKLVFIIFDVLVGRSIHSLVRHSGHSKETARNCALVWLVNPLSATVSSRGNAESIMAFLVLMSLSSLIKGRTVLSAVFYGLAVHFKIYPITYILPIYLYLGQDSSKFKNDTSEPPSKTLNLWTSLVNSLLPNKQRLLFTSVSGAVLGMLSGFFYWMYGWTFLYETYLYHIVRGDIKHNFSPYFYLLYLTSDPITGVPICLRLLVFIPQVLLLVVVAAAFHRDQPLAWFLCTFVFVMANKVCTSQYFLWYLSLLPVILPYLKLSMVQACSLLALWFSTQGLWLLPAYYLEFKGQNTFIYIWMASLLFFAANAFIVYYIVKHYRKTR